MRDDLIALEDGRTCDMRQMTIEDLRVLIKSMEMEVVIHGGARMPKGYVQLVVELYQRTGGRAPGEKQAVAAYGNSKRPRTTWRKL